MIQKAKGTYDVYGIYGKKLLYVEELLEGLMEKYNYEYFRTPIFESSNLFHRGVGETTDIITKETYDFKDKGDRLLTLRPEGTAGIVRSFIENKIYGTYSMPIKTWYYGPMYRYERPQKGRFREFYQFGVEVFGSNSPILDAEVISIPVNFFKLLGLKNVKVKINTLGDSESRQRYREALIKYFEPNIDSFCSDCRDRLKKNPLRILDCKVDKENELLKNAPKTIDYLNEESKKHFEDVKKYLDTLNIEYIVDTNLVRGLDYYTHTVFEVEADIKDFGSQNVLCGGGRYNNLVETLDGPKTDGVGFAMGMERVMEAIASEDIHLDIVENIDCYIIPLSFSENEYATKLCMDLRLNGFIVDMDYDNKNIKSNFKVATKKQSKYVIIIGEEEQKTNILTIKDNNTKEEYKVKYEELIDFLDEKVM